MLNASPRILNSRNFNIVVVNPDTESGEVAARKGAPLTSAAAPLFRILKLMAE